jgi:putative flavoprotein involved in K+ transport
MVGRIGRAKDEDHQMSTYLLAGQPSELTQRGIEHAVLERGKLGQSWRGRWDSFCLVTPNWFVRLPGHRYDGDDPDGYMPRDEIVAYLERYAAGFDAPVREGIDVVALRPRPEGGFQLETSAGAMSAHTVVLTTGAFQQAHRPARAAGLPHDLLQIDVEQYRNPAGLPAGPVLVVGSGQSGCQIAEELHRAGRDVSWPAAGLPGSLAGSAARTCRGG